MNARWACGFCNRPLPPPAPGDRLWTCTAQCYLNWFYSFFNSRAKILTAQA